MGRSPRPMQPITKNQMLMENFWMPTYVGATGYVGSMFPTTTSTLRKLSCGYCKCKIDSTVDSCPNCGAPNNN